MNIIGGIEKAEKGILGISGQSLAYMNERMLSLYRRKHLGYVYHKNVTFENENTLRVFKNRTEVNKVCLMEGNLPTSDKEISIDGLYAENNEISLKDSIKVNGKDYSVSGFVALSDYSALFKNNTDMMLDAKRFYVGLVTDEAFL